MTAFLRRWSWIGVFLTALGITGCNVLALPFFIFGPEPAVEAGLKKVASDKKKEPTRVVVLAHSAMGPTDEFLRADRDLTERVRTQLKTMFEYNKENVKLVSWRTVEDFKNENPGWQTMDFDKIGKQLGADYVIYLEIKKLSLYEPGNGLLYRGRADVTVTLIDVTDPDEAPMRREFICQFPSEIRQAIPVEDVNPAKFKNDFLNYVAQRLSWYFTSHPTRMEHDCQ